MKHTMYKGINKYELYSYMFEVYPHTISQYEDVERAYLKILKGYCKYLRINYKSTIRFLMGLTDQNWERLHESDKEQEQSLKELFESFRYELMYVYDRFSYSRMLRLHYFWIIFSKRLFKEIMKEQKINFLDENYYDYYHYVDEHY